ncbi:sialidase family protein [Thiomicrorhabdus aquaedulcis]|uniref:sialidase family protein n=1 Tax=Thiomicrorhabdus aquaedulcis TaxID=2211106 RepID=UPI000FDCA0BA|nr:sialidase family protein [Thiomicrorhabdus aquaedulcis]
MNLTQKPLALAMALAMGASISGLSGCSDTGSSDSTAAAETETLTGTFVDSPVNGLTFKGALNGTTQNGGLYQFKKGGMVSFYLGDKIKLGQLLGRTDQVSPLDFFGPDATIDQRVLNILVLLQSLDNDANPSNGITITAESVAALEAALLAKYPNIDLTTLDFSQMSLEDATELKADLIAILQAVVEATANPEDDDAVVTEDEAEAHFTEVMSGDITVHKNISRTPEAGSGGHSIVSMMLKTPSYSTTGEVDETTEVRPLLVSYTDTMTGDFLMGTGSSELPDIEHFADTFVSLSLDSGKSWKAINVSNTADNSSIKVDFDGDGSTEDYFGHSFKPAIKTEGGYVMVAWNDKFCPSGDPGELSENAIPDLYLVNGPQKTINYEGEAMYGDEIIPAHEVPFSCVWTARGVFNEATHSIDWRAPEQLTTGRRDSNKITIDAGPEGFVLAWQEDPEGLRPGGGEGPGDGWSGASTNHRTDIWYSYIAIDDFAAIDDAAVTGGTPTSDETSKPKALNKLSSPVPVSDNAVCNADNVNSETGALYCESLCTANGSVEDAESKDNGKCYSAYLDPIRAIYNDTPESELQLLNGDTGASRPILGLFGDQVILGYEETKGEAESLPGVPNSETLDTIPIEAQGKIAYVHSFPMTLPTPIAPGTIVNKLMAPDPDRVRPVPDNNPENLPVLENVRRLTLISQVDESDVNDDNVQHRWGILYKSGIETQGASSDMYLRLAKGGYDVSNLTSTHWNLSSRTPNAVETLVGTWDANNLNDATWKNNLENTFSPRGYLSGNDIIVGYEYTPSWRVASVGHLSNNFNIIRSFDNGANWQAPIDVSNITNNQVSTLDPRLIPTSEPIDGVETRDANTLFVTYGTMDMGTGLELDLFVTRSTDNGTTWDKVPANADGELINEAIVQSVAEEKEVQNIASPDGKTLYSLWLQELDPSEAPESAAAYLLGSDIWAQRKDYDVAEETIEEIIEETAQPTLAQ